jgi:hypothetical protein
MPYDMFFTAVPQIQVYVGIETGIIVAKGVFEASPSIPLTGCLTTLARVGDIPLTR